jgi:1-deoxy-D-xylulose-5-phosphate reductoisomerase
MTIATSTHANDTNSYPSKFKTHSSKLKNVTILGATGTIGQHTLDVIAQHPEAFNVFAVTANQNVDGILAICKLHQPKFAVLLDENAAAKLKASLVEAKLDTQVLCGAEALCAVASHQEVDIVMAAIVGAAGLLSAMAAAEAGKQVLLANKETLVMAGSLFMQAIAKSGAILLPIDSEHNAIFQVMPTQKQAQLNNIPLKALGVKRILLTASGGPFREATDAELQAVTPAQALNHPNWIMGPKITIDSATLMNKGLEVIEAHWLFNAQPSEIDVVVHPQSIIHSMVEYVDGSVLAQLGNPDMRTPIAYGLAYPERLSSGVNSLDLIKIGCLEFKAVDTKRFPCLRLAYDALKLGGTAPAILNAANEVAVEAFLAGKIAFLTIPVIIEQVLNSAVIVPVESIAQLIDVDIKARRVAKSHL